MNIAFVSHSAFHPAMVVGSHQLARVWAKLGHRVIHVSLPLTPFHLSRIGRPHMKQRFDSAWGGATEREPNLIEWVPLAAVPWDVAKYLSAPLGHNFSVPLAKRIRAVLSRFGFSSIDVALIDEPRMVGVEPVLQARKTVYRATDLYAQYRGDPSILDAERKILASADGIFATSDPVARHLRDLSGGREVDVFRNGFDADHFRERRDEDPSLAGIDGPRAVYVGAIDHRLDLDGVVGMALRRPDLNVLMYGPTTISLPADSPSNLRWMGPITYDRLPAVLQHCDVAMLPLVDNEENHGRSPMKYFEYRSSNIPIAAFAAESLAPLSSSDSLFLYQQAGASGLGEAVDAALAFRRDPQGFSTTNLDDDMSWQQIASRMLTRIESLHL
ncbi:glycosyltransferase [Rubripirellula lacrimiformis]|uniref:glycosyltransferase n=1 Tax=Rubripirellula lacrimiformis TaxID=1930273 RepID=UPI001C54CA9B|nr:glycosyltransferase [Rubripirellula lacrimiformis]